MVCSAHIDMVVCLNRKVSRKQQDNDVTEWAATQAMPGPAENDSDVETQRQVLQCRQKCHLRLQVQGGDWRATRRQPSSERSTMDA